MPIHSFFRIRWNLQSFCQVIHFTPPAKTFTETLLEVDIDPENLATHKEFPADGSRPINNEKAFEETVSGSDLDVPGSELDDEEENIGSEDEENNYYSISGDNHQDLEEDRG